VNGGSAADLDADTPGGLEAGARHLFVAAGGGGDVLAASMLQRKLYGGGRLPYVVTYSWDRLITDPEPGPRGVSSFANLEAFGEHNFLVTARSHARRGRSLLPRLAEELSVQYYLLDPYRGATGMRLQLAELVRLLHIERVSLVDSGGDILAAGDEEALRSPLADSLALAAAAAIGAPVDVLVTGSGLDGELSSSYVRGVVEKLGGDVGWLRLGAADVEWFRPLLSWHPSEVNGLLIAAARGFEGTVEIRDAALEVRVDASSALVHRCRHGAAIEHNLLAKSLLTSTSLADAEDVMMRSRGYSEVDYQRTNVERYRGAPLDLYEIKQRFSDLSGSGGTRQGVDALTLRRAAEVVGIYRDQLEDVGPMLEAWFPEHFTPPLWRLR
jgi:hypothetical protein